MASRRENRFFGKVKGVPQRRIKNSKEEFNIV